MPPITYSINDMPALSAAFGSFHVKSSSRSFVNSWITVRGLPLILTITFFRSTTLTVSCLGVRWYTDHRYWSMQTSGTRHSSSVSLELTASSVSVCTGSEVLTVAICPGGVSGATICEESGNDLSRVSVALTASLSSVWTGSGVRAVAICAGGVSGASIGVSGASVCEGSNDSSRVSVELTASLVWVCTGSGERAVAIRTGGVSGASTCGNDSSRVSVELTASLASVYTGSRVLTDALCGESGNGASTIVSATLAPPVPVAAAAAVTASALETPAMSIAVVCGASTGLASPLRADARSSIGAASAFLMPAKPKPPTAAMIQPAIATVPHNAAAIIANRRELISPPAFCGPDASAL